MILEGLKQTFCVVKNIIYDRSYITYKPSYKHF